MTAAAHPRPLLRRDGWTSLDGIWDFVIDGDARWGEPAAVRFDRRIRVPFAPEAPASGIDDRGLYRCVWYRRHIALPHAGGGRLLLNFGAVDHAATVWVDGTEVARHEGGYAPFSADVTAFAGGERALVVRAYDDPSDLEMPRGKQDWEAEPHAIWYPRTTGIWQTVWLEAVPRSSVVSVRWWTDDLRTLSFDASLEARDGARLTAELRANGEVVARVAERASAGHVRGAVAIANAPALRWSPEQPRVIEVALELRDDDRVDRARSYAALRTVGTSGGKVVLNGEPYPLRMALDQGYWPDGGLSAPDDAALARDVELARALGFNGVRKHQKAEDPRWLEQCDRLGLLVFDEMPSPRVFGERAKRRLIGEWREIVERDRSHPAVVAWVPFNESWGVEGLDGSQAEVAHVSEVRDLTRELDPTRPVISNDGWQWVGGDVIGIHDYATDPAVLRARYGTASALARTLANERPEGRRLLLAPHQGEPVLLSEFGGLRIGDDEGWGYATVAPNELVGRYAELCDAARSDALAGFCYTQLTDTYQERNGLLRMDRTPKAPIAELRAATGGI